MIRQQAVDGQGVMMAGHIARRRRENPRTAWRVVLVLWIAFIWIHSMIPGPISSDESLFFVRLVRPLFELFGIHDGDLMHTIVRKGAHFSEYLVLGVLTIAAFNPRIAVPLFPAVLTVLLWVAVPSVDEAIQLHVPGRAGALTDVLIDMSGFVVGAIISLAVRNYVEQRERKLAEHERLAREARADRYRRMARRKAYERAGKPVPESLRDDGAGRLRRHSEGRGSYEGSRHAVGAPVVSRGRHERIQSEPEANRLRFEHRTRY